MTLRVSLTVNPSYVLLGAEVAYIEMVVAAGLDASGRYRYIDDSVVSIDGSSFTLTKAFSSGVTVSTEQVVFSFEKNINDSVEMLDELERTLVFIRDSGDTQEVLDQFASTFSKPVAETVLAQDVKAIVVSKSLADGFAMNDGAEATDGSVYSFSKGVANVAFVSDVSTLSHSKTVADGVATADSGLLTMQDYCDITYFSEDYVGISTVF